MRICGNQFINSFASPSVNRISTFLAIGLHIGLRKIAVISVADFLM